MRVHECRSPWKTEVSDLLKLELQNVVSHLLWVLGTEKGPLEGHPALFTADHLHSLCHLNFIKERGLEELLSGTAIAKHI